MLPSETWEGGWQESKHQAPRIILRIPHELVLEHVRLAKHNLESSHLLIHHCNRTGVSCWDLLTRLEQGHIHRIVELSLQSAHPFWLISLSLTDARPCWSCEALINWDQNAGTRTCWMSSKYPRLMTDWILVRWPVMKCHKRPGSWEMRPETWWSTLRKTAYVGTSWQSGLVQNGAVNGSFGLKAGGTNKGLNAILGKH